MLKIPPDLNPLAMEYWERALASPTPQNIWCFYVLAGMDRHYRDFQVSWQECLT